MQVTPSNNSSTEALPEALPVNPLSNLQLIAINLPEWEPVGVVEFPGKVVATIEGRFTLKQGELRMRSGLDLNAKSVLVDKGGLLSPGGEIVIVSQHDFSFNKAEAFGTTMTFKSTEGKVLIRKTDLVTVSCEIIIEAKKGVALSRINTNSGLHVVSGRDAVIHRIFQRREEKNLLITLHASFVVTVFECHLKSALSLRGKIGIRVQRCFIEAFEGRMYFKTRGRLLFQDSCIERASDFDMKEVDLLQLERSYLQALKVGRLVAKNIAGSDSILEMKTCEIEGEIWVPELTVISDSARIVSKTYVVHLPNGKFQVKALEISSKLQLKIFGSKFAGDDLKFKSQEEWIEADGCTFAGQQHFEARKGSVYLHGSEHEGEKVVVEGKTPDIDKAHFKMQRSIKISGERIREKQSSFEAQEIETNATLSLLRQEVTQEGESVTSDSADWILEMGSETKAAFMRMKGRELLLFGSRFTGDAVLEGDSVSLVKGVVKGERFDAKAEGALFLPNLNSRVEKLMLKAKMVLAHECDIASSKVTLVGPEGVSVAKGKVEAQSAEFKSEQNVNLTGADLDVKGLWEVEGKSIATADATIHGPGGIALTAEVLPMQGTTKVDRIAMHATAGDVYILGEVEADRVAIKQKNFIDPVKVKANSLEVACQASILWTRTMSLPGDFALESEGDIEVQGGVTATGKGSLLADRDITLKGAFRSNSGAAFRGRNFNLVYRSILEVKGDVDLDVKDLINDACRPRIDGDIRHTGVNVKNLSRVHVEENQVVTGKHKKRFCGVRTGSTTLHATIRRIVVDALATIEVTGIWKLLLTGSVINEGDILAGRIAGTIGGNLENGMFRVSGRRDQPLGQIHVATDCTLDVAGLVRNSGYMVGGGDLLLTGGGFENAPPVTEEQEDGLRVRSWGRHRKVSVKTDVASPGGVVNFRNTDIKMNNIANTGGSISGLADTTLRAMNMQNRPLELRGINHLRRGKVVPWKALNAYSKTTAIQPSLAAAGDDLRVQIEQRLENIASHFIAGRHLFMQAGDLVQRTVFTSHKKEVRRGFNERDIFEVEKHEPGIRAVKGNAKLELGTGEIEGQIGSLEGDLDIKSKGPLKFLTKELKAQNRMSGWKFTPTSISYSETDFESGEVSRPTLFAGRNMSITAGEELTFESPVFQVGGDLSLETPSLKMIDKKIIREQSESGFSLGIKFFCSSILEGESVGQALLKEDPFLMHAYQLMHAKDMGDVGLHAPLAFAYGWNTAEKFVEAYSQGKLKNAIGEHCGITDKDGKFSPKFTIRFGISESSLTHIIALNPQLQVGGNFTVRAADQLYQGVTGKVGGDTHLIGKRIDFQASKSETIASQSGAGVSLSFAGTTPVSLGVDYSAAESHEAHYEHGRIATAGKVTIDASERLTRETPENTKESKSTSFSLSTSGAVSFNSSHSKSVGDNSYHRETGFSIAPFLEQKPDGIHLKENRETFPVLGSFEHRKVVVQDGKKSGTHIGVGFVGYDAGAREERQRVAAAEALAKIKPVVEEVPPPVVVPQIQVPQEETVEEPLIACEDFTHPKPSEGGILLHRAGAMGVHAFEKAFHYVMKETFKDRRGEYFNVTEDKPVKPFSYHEYRSWQAADRRARLVEKTVEYAKKTANWVKAKTPVWVKNVLNKGGKAVYRAYIKGEEQAVEAHIRCHGMEPARAKQYIDDITTIATFVLGWAAADGVFRLGGTTLKTSYKVTKKTASVAKDVAKDVASVFKASGSGPKTPISKMNGSIKFFTPAAEPKATHFYHRQGEPLRDLAKIKDFTHQDDPVQQFAKSFVLPDDKLILLPEQLRLLQKVYRVHDFQRESSFFVKSLSVKGMEKELAGYQFLNDLGIKEIYVPKWLGSAKYTIDYERALMAVEALPGKSVFRWIEHLKTNPESFPECLNIMRTTGTGLGKLHAETQKPKVVVPKANVDLFIEEATHYANEAREVMAKNLRPKLSKETLDKITDAFASSKELASHTLEDAWAGNFIYQPGKKIGVIDPAGILNSVNTEGLPTGLPALDFHVFRASLESAARQQGLPKEMIKELVDAFAEGYVKANKVPFSQEADLFGWLNGNLLTLQGRWFKPTVDNLAAHIKEFNEVIDTHPLLKKKTLFAPSSGGLKTPVSKMRGFIDMLPPEPLPKPPEYHHRSIKMEFAEELVTPQEFAKKAFPRKKVEIIPQEKFLSPFELGNSGSAVHFILDAETRKPLMVLKEFTFFSFDRLEMEKRALESLARLNLQHLDVPKVLVFGGQEPVGYLGISFQKGKGLLAELKDLSKLPSGSEREIQFGEFAKTIEDLGKGMGEFHEHSRLPSRPVDLEFLKRISDEFFGFATDLHRTLQENGNPFAFDIAFVEKSYQEYLLARGPAGYVRGDANLKNFLSDGKRITMLDMSLLAHTIGESGEPLGASILDYQQILLNFDAYKFAFHLSEAETQLLKEAFIRGYNKQFPGVYSEAANQFARLFWYHHLISAHSGNKNIVKFLVEQCNQEFGAGLKAGPKGMRSFAETVAGSKNVEIIPVGNEVYNVQAGADSILIKKFTQPGEFEKEYHALITLEKFDHLDFIPQKVLGVEIEKDVQLLAITKGEGKPLNDLLSDLTGLRGEKRAQALKKMNQTFLDIGLVIGNIGSLGVQKGVLPSTKHLDALAASCRSLYEELATIEKNLFVSKQEVESAIAGLYKNPGEARIVHGNLRSPNIFVGEKAGAISLTDFTAESLTESGLLSTDLCTFMEHIRGLQGLKPSETDQLIASLKKGLHLSRIGGVEHSMTAEAELFAVLHEKLVWKLAAAKSGAPGIEETAKKTSLLKELLSRFTLSGSGPKPPISKMRGEIKFFSAEEFTPQEFADRVLKGAKKVKVVSQELLLNPGELGKSGAGVHFAVEAATGKPMMVIKEMSTAGPNGNELVNERLALGRLAELHPRPFEVPEVLEFGLHPTKEVGFIGLTFHEGKGLAHELETLSNLPSGSIRDKAFQQFATKMEDLGERSGKFHGHSRSPSRPVDPTYLKDAIDSLMESAEKVHAAFKEEGIPFAITIEDIQKYAHDYTWARGPSGYRRGDFSLQNFLSDGEKITMFDLHSCASSIGKSGEPIGASVLDYQQMLINFDIYKFGYKLSDAEGALVKNAFIQGYKKVFPGIHSEAANRFARLYWYHHLGEIYLNAGHKSGARFLVKSCNEEFGGAYKPAPRGVHPFAENIAGSTEVEVIPKGEGIYAAKELLSGESFIIRKYPIDGTSDAHMGEFRALKTLERLKPTHFKVPKILGVEMEGDVHLLAMTRMEGEPLNHLLDGLAAMSGEKRAQELVRMEGIFEKIGISLSELGTMGADSAIAPSKPYLDTLADSCRRLYKQLAKIEKKPFVKKVEVEKAIADLYANPGRAAFAHGKLRAPNIIVNESGEISLVDFTGMEISIVDRRLPGGLGSTDLCTFIEHFRLAPKGLKSPEIDRLIDAFKKGAQPSMTKEAELFSSLHEKLQWHLEVASQSARKTSLLKELLSRFTLSGSGPKPPVSKMGGFINFGKGETFSPKAFAEKILGKEVDVADSLILEKGTNTPLMRVKEVYGPLLQHELRALEKLSSLKLNKLEVPELIESALQGDTGLIATTCPQGSTLASIFKRLSKHSIDDKKWRGGLHKSLVKGVELLGEAVGELGGKTPGRPVPLSTIDRLGRGLQDLVSDMEGSPFIAEDIAQLTHELKSVPIPASYTLGAGALDNILVHSEKLSLISSFERVTLEPTGIPAMDYYGFLFRILREALDANLSHSETIVLRKAFNNGFKKSFPGELPEASARFARVYWGLIDGHAADSLINEFKQWPAKPPLTLDRIIAQSKNPRAVSMAADILEANREMKEPVRSLMQMDAIVPFPEGIEVINLVNFTPEEFGHVLGRLVEKKASRVQIQAYLMESANVLDKIEKQIALFDKKVKVTIDQESLAPGYSASVLKLRINLPKAQTAKQGVRPGLQLVPKMEVEIPPLSIGPEELAVSLPKRAEPPALSHLSKQGNEKVKAAIKHLPGVADATPTHSLTTFKYKAEDLLTGLNLTPENIPRMLNAGLQRIEHRSMASYESLMELVQVVREFDRKSIILVAPHSPMAKEIPAYEAIFTLQQVDKPLLYSVNTAKGSAMPTAAEIPKKVKALAEKCGEMPADLRIHSLVEISIRDTSTLKGPTYSYAANLNETTLQEIITDAALRSAHFRSPELKISGYFARPAEMLGVFEKTLPFNEQNCVVIGEAVDWVKGVKAYELEFTTSLKGINPPPKKSWFNFAPSSGGPKTPVSKMKGFIDFSLGDIKVEKFAAKVAPGRKIEVYTSDRALTPVERGTSGLLHFIYEGEPLKPTIALKELSSAPFDQEVRMLHMMKTLGLKHFDFPELIAAQSGGAKGIFAMTFKPGKGIAYQVQEASLLSLGSGERLTAIHNLANALERVGTGLAEFHGKDRTASLPPSKIYLDDLWETFERMSESVNERAAKLGMPINVSEKTLRDIPGEFCDVPGPAGRVHGDAHLKNFLDDGTRTSVIDFELTGKSVAMDGTPIGAPVLDVERLLLNLKIFGEMRSLTGEEATLLKEAFLKGYRAEFPGFHPETGRRFGKLFNLYKLLDQTLDVPKDAARLIKILNEEFETVKKAATGLEDFAERVCGSKGISLKQLQENSWVATKEGVIIKKLSSEEALHEKSFIAKEKTDDGYYIAFQEDKGVSFRNALKLPEEQQKGLERIIESFRKNPDLENFEVPPAFDMEDYFVKAVSGINPVKDISTESRATLYRAGEKGDLGFVQKQDDLNEIIEEVKGLYYLGKLNLQRAQVPEILGCELKGSEGVLYMTLLPGKPVKAFLDQLAGMPKEAPEREAMLQKIHLALCKLGEALGELHSKERHFPAPEKQINGDLRDLHAYYTRVKEFAEKYRLEIPHPPEEFERVVEAFKKEPKFSSFVHEDPHLGNFLFDEASGKISFIDTPSTYITSLGIPEKSGIHYFNITSGWLNEASLPLEERQHLQELFFNAYASTFEGGVPQASNRFYQMVVEYENISKLLQEFFVRDSEEIAERSAILKEFFKSDKIPDSKQLIHDYYHKRGEPLRDLSSLKDFTSHKGEEIEAFAREFIRLQELNVIPVQQRPYHKVYRVEDSERGTSLFVKSLPMSELSSEVEGYAILQGYLEEMKVPQWFGSGKYTEGVGTRALVALEAIPGKSILNWIEGLKVEPPTYKECLEMVRSAGRGMGNLHHKSRVEVPIPHENMNAMIEELTPWAKQKLPKETFNRVAELFEEGKHPGCITHGDAQGNNFIALPGEKIGVIDPASVLNSIGKDGVPTGLASIDYHVFLATLESAGRQNRLTKEMIKSLSDAFAAGYRETNPVPFTPEADLFGWLNGNLLTMSGRWGKQSARNMAAHVKEFNHVIATHPLLGGKLLQEHVEFQEAFIAQCRMLPSAFEKNPLQFPAIKKPPQFDLTAHLVESIPGQVEEIALNDKVVHYRAEGHGGFIKKTDRVEEIMKEVKALAIFNDLKLERIKVPQIIGCQVNESEAVLFTTPMPGKPVEGQLAIRRLGEALGELHSKDRSFKLPEAIVEMDIGEFQKNRMLIKEFAGQNKLELPHATKELNELVEKFRKEPGFAAFVSEDGNFLFDETTGQISIINLSAKHVTSRGVPKAPPMKYFHQTLRQLKDDAGLFLGGYESTFAGGLPLPANRFYQFYAQYKEIVQLIKSGGSLENNSFFPKKNSLMKELLSTFTPSGSGPKPPVSKMRGSIDLFSDHIESHRRAVAFGQPISFGMKMKGESLPGILAGLTEAEKEEVFFKVGVAIGELGRPTGVLPSKEHLDTLVAHCRKLYEEFERVEKRPFISKEEFEQVVAALYKNPGEASITHGALQPSKILWNAEKKEITFAEAGIPDGLASTDICAFMHTLEAGEKQSFLKGVEQAAGKPMTKEACEFSTLYENLKTARKSLAQKGPATAPKTEAATPVGIPNIGNSCYIASTVQSLIASPRLMQKIYAPLTKRIGETPAQFEEREAIQKALKDLIDTLKPEEGESSIAAALTNFRKAVFDNQRLNAAMLTAQHDAAELMMTVLDVIDHHVELQEHWWVPGRPLPDVPMVQRNQLIDIEISGEKSLQELINEAFAVRNRTDADNRRNLFNESFDSWAEQMRLTNRPDVVVFHLKRFTSNGGKIETPVHLPENRIIDLNEERYQMVSTVRHSGGTQFGHYTAHVKGRNWIECNDATVFPIQEQADARFQNYLLVFERVTAAAVPAALVAPPIEEDRSPHTTVATLFAGMAINVLNAIVPVAEAAELPPESRVSFNRLWNAFKYLGYEQKLKWADNFCALDVSHALVQAGAPAMTRSDGELAKYEDTSLLFRIKDVTNYLKKNEISKPPVRIFNFTQLHGKKGIISFEGGLINATGHMTLWNGQETHPEDIYCSWTNDCQRVFYRVKEVYFYEMEEYFE